MTKNDYLTTSLEYIEALSRKNSLPSSANPLAGLAEKRRPSKQPSNVSAVAIKQELLFDRKLKEKMAIGDGIGEKEKAAKHHKF